MSYVGSGDEQSEDGELRQSPAEPRQKPEMDFSLSEEDGDNMDGLDIKPPQAQKVGQSSRTKRREGHERHHKRSERHRDERHSHRSKHHRSEICKEELGIKSSESFIQHTSLLSKADMQMGNKEPINQQLNAGEVTNPTASTSFTENSICTPPTTINRKPLFVHSLDLTPKEQYLMKIIKTKERRIRKLKQSFKKQRFQIKDLHLVKDSPEYKKIFKGMSPSTRDFLISQIRCSRQHPEGRWSLDEKLMSLVIFKTSPRCYNFLSKIYALPSKGTLLTMLNEVPFNVGINNHIFTHLSNCLSSRDKRDRLCTVSFAEMSLKEHIAYNTKTDCIVGFEDLGNRPSVNVANYALVLMAQGIWKEWKQPLAFYFSNGGVKSDQLVEILKNVLTALEKVNLTVIATVCDMGTRNLKAMETLGCTLENPYFKLNGRSIYSIFDVPHLLICTRNLFRKYNIDLPVSETITLDSKKQNLEARWEDFDIVYKRDKCNPIRFRYLYRLTDTHLGLKSNKVKIAAQVLSKSASGLMYFFAKRGVLPPRAVATAYFIVEMDEIFDSLNGTAEDAPDGKPLKCMVTKRSGHSDFWLKSINEIKQWRYLKNPNVMWTPLSQKGWLHTLKAFIGIQKLLREHRVYTFKPRIFNKDPLENFFGAIRSGCGCNENLTVAGFISSFKCQIMNNSENQSFEDSDFEDSDCEEYDVHILFNLRSLIETETCITNLENSDVPISHNVVIDTINIKELVQGGHIDCLSVVYVAEFIVKKLFSKFSCDVCTSILCSDANEIILAKEHVLNKKAFHYPSDQLVIYIGRALTGIEEYLQNNGSQINLYTKLIQYLGKSIDHKFLDECSTHSIYLRDLLLTSTCKIGILSYCKRFSLELNEQRKQKKIQSAKKLQNI